MHRLYIAPPPLHPGSSDAAQPLPGAARFPFSLRANVVDRNAVLVPTGWDSWGKIQVVQEGFKPGDVLKGWEKAVEKQLNDKDRDEGEIRDDDEEEGIEGMWAGIVPDVNTGYRVGPVVTEGSHALKSPTQDSAPRDREVHVEPEQAFLARQLEMLMRDPQRDPRKAFRSVSGQPSRLGSNEDAFGASAGRGSGGVGPMAAGGLNLPSVDMAMREMEGLQTPTAARRVRSRVSVGSTIS